jgi:predicted NAD/FAD-binding protein
VEIESNGTVENFDYVLFATHADTTLQLLADATEEEKTALGRFQYTVNSTVLHNDSSVLPDKKRLLAAWNYSVAKAAGREAYAVFTYCMNILQHIDKKVPVYVTLNPPIQIPPEKVYAQETYSHPQYSIASLQGQAELKALQGQRHTLFTGAHLGYGFHEDGVQSAIDAVGHLGVRTPWEL